MTNYDLQKTFATHLLIMTKKKDINYLEQKNNNR